MAAPLRQADQIVERSRLSLNGTVSLRGLP